MDRVTQQPKKLSEIFAECKAELDTVPDGFVDLRIYKSNNALENHDITTHRRNKGKIEADSAMN